MGSVGGSMRHGTIHVANNGGEQKNVPVGSPSYGEAPPVLLPTFLGEGSPPTIDYRENIGYQLILTSLLDLVVKPVDIGDARFRNPAAFWTWTCPIAALGPRQAPACHVRPGRHASGSDRFLGIKACLA